MYVHCTDLVNGILHNINVSLMLVFSCMTLVATLYILHMLALSVDHREGTADHHRWPRCGGGQLNNQLLPVLEQPLGLGSHTGRRHDNCVYCAVPLNIRSTLSPTVGDS